MGRNPENYGRYAWTVKVPESVKSTGEFFLLADRPDFDPSGALKMIGHLKGPDIDTPGPEQVVFAFAPGKWIHVYASGVYDEEPICMYDEEPFNIRRVPAAKEAAETVKAE